MVATPRRGDDHPRVKSLVVWGVTWLFRRDFAADLRYCAMAGRSAAATKLIISGDWSEDVAWRWLWCAPFVALGGRAWREGVDEDAVVSGIDRMLDSGAEAPELG